MKINTYLSNKNKLILKNSFDHKKIQDIVGILKFLSNLSTLRTKLII